jgi:O-antigen ligase
MSRFFDLRAGGFCLAGAAFILPTLAIYAPLGITPLLILIAVGVLLLAGKRSLAGLTGLGWLIALFAALDLWGLLSASWSIVPQHSLVQALRFLSISAAGFIILGAARTTTETERRRIGHVLLAGIGLATILLIIERFGGAPIMRFWHPLSAQGLQDRTLVFYRFDRGVIVIVLTLWTACFAAAPRGLRLGLCAIAAIMTTLMISTAAALALVAGLCVVVLARFAPATTAMLILAGLLTISIVVPLATPNYDRVAAIHAQVPQIKWSGIHRLLIWRFASDRAAERPILGWGMDASRAVPGGDTDLVPQLPPGNYPAEAKALPLHPHNGALELLLELGLPGLILGLAIIAGTIVTITWRRALPPDSRAGALALVASCLTIGFLSFGVWQEWWQSSVWLAVALFAAVAIPRDITAPSAAATPASPTA